MMSDKQTKHPASVTFGHLWVTDDRDLGAEPLLEFWGLEIWTLNT